MKQLTISEKFYLIRSHGDHLSKTGCGIPMSNKSDVIESAERILELAKSIPKIHWAIEE